MEKLQTIICVKFKRSYNFNKVNSIIFSIFNRFSSVTEIGESAFESCSLSNIILSNSLKKLENMIFAYADIRKIIIPDSVTSIGDYAFDNCVYLTDITLPKNLKEIGFEAFKNCNDLKEIEIPESVAAIGENAFEGCDEIKIIMPPSSVIGIDKVNIKNE